MGCPALRFTLCSWLGLRKRENQELQLGRDVKEAAKGKGGLQREHGWEEFLVWALTGGLGVSIWLHVRVRVDRKSLELQREWGLRALSLQLVLLLMFVLEEGS